MELSNIGYEANGVTHCNPSSPSIYAMYSADLKCIDFHEDTHAIACQYACPDSIAIIEGLAMHFDKVWWSIPNELCLYIYLEDDKYESVERLIRDNQYFYKIPDSISYPIIGAFTTYLIGNYGIEKYKLLYQTSKDVYIAFKELNGISLTELEHDFINACQFKRYSPAQYKNARKKLYC